MASTPSLCRRPSTIKFLVWVLRGLGVYYFKKPSHAATADTVEINLPLLLWAIFVKTFQIIFIMYASFCITKIEVGDVGTLTKEVNIVSAAVFEVLGQSSLLINGNILCQILIECEEDGFQGRRNAASYSVTISSSEGIINLLFYCSFLQGTILGIINTAYDNPNGEATIVMHAVFGTTVMAGMMLSAMLFREALVIASIKLSVDILQDASFLREGAAGPGQRLDTLEKMIRKVELLREKIVSFFLTEISLLACGQIFSVIINMYSFIRLLTDSYPSFKWYNQIVFVMVGISTLLHLCYSAHHFSRHVHGVSSQLRDLRLAVRDEENRVQLHYLISTLERMETFDMGSWYHLGPNTLVSITTFVVTYLVVMLQVGNRKTQVESWPKANTTAT